jgi:post-segregation antitoxin (ccd killing protein)
MSDPKPTRSFRIEQALIDKAKAAGLDITMIAEAAIAKAVNDKRCPYCRQELKKTKSK